MPIYAFYQWTIDFLITSSIKDFFHDQCHLW